MKQEVSNCNRNVSLTLHTKSLVCISHVRRELEAGSVVVRKIKERGKCDV